MERDRKFRALAIAAICVAVVGISVAYAALQATLSIEGTTSVGTLTDAWDINFQDPSFVDKDSSIEVIKEPAVSGTNDQMVTWEAKFTAPNTSLTFSVGLRNDGTLNAKLLPSTGDYNSYIRVSGDFLTVTDFEDMQQISDAFEYTVKINDSDISTKTGAILLSGGPENWVTLTVTVKLKDMDNARFAALANKKAVFELYLPFEQAADGEVTPTF